MKTFFGGSYGLLQDVNPLLSPAFPVLICSQSNALRIRCTNLPVSFEFEALGEIRCLCKTTKAALEFLESIGLAAETTINIRVVNHFPSVQAHNVIGYYHADSREVYILNYTEVKKRHHGDPFLTETNASEKTWCSYSAHELAHAISSHRVQRQTRGQHLAGEYIAAVTQLMVLPPETRDLLLKKYQHIKAYKSTAEISLYYYLLAPKEFAVKCYRHFITLDDPGEFIAQLLENGIESWEGY